MNNIVKTIIGTVIILFLLDPVSAQQIMTLKECRQRAVNYNKQLKKAQFQKEEAEEQKKIARTTYLPSVSADVTLMQLISSEEINTNGSFLPTADSEEAAQNGEFTGTSDVWMPGMSFEIDNTSLIYGGLSVSQPIYAGGKINAGVKMAEAGFDITGMAYDLKFSEVIELTDQAFWNVAMVEANIELADKYIEMLSELEDLTTSMYELGLHPASEKLKVNVQRNEAELQLMIAKNGLKIATMNLNQILGHELEKEITIVYDSLINLRLIDLSNGVSLASRNRNELKIMDKQIYLAELEKQMTLGDYLPQLGISIQYTGTYLTDFKEDISFNPMIAAQLSIPIFQWGQGRHKQKAAQLKIKQNQTEFNRTNDLINLEVMSTKVKVEEAFEAIQIAEKNIEASEENLSETKSSFEVGLNSTTDLLNAQANWLNAKAQQIRALAQYKVLETSWRRVTGNLNSTE
jgi:outer membrane protein